MLDLQKVKHKISNNQEFTGVLVGATTLGSLGLAIGPKIGIAGFGGAISGAVILPMALATVGAITGYAAVKAYQARKIVK
ncbi:MAG: hypothetical protein LW833_02730 [Hyphomicrobiales bacterium]|nr:hypothetical protein [Hyphomicrobiales bacterium]